MSFSLLRSEIALRFGIALRSNDLEKAKVAGEMLTDFLSDKYKDEENAEIIQAEMIRMAFQLVVDSMKGQELSSDVIKALFAFNPDILPYLGILRNALGVNPTAGVEDYKVLMSAYKEGKLELIGDNLIENFIAVMAVQSVMTASLEDQEIILEDLHNFRKVER